MRENKFRAYHKKYNQIYTVRMIDWAQDGSIRHLRVIRPIPMEDGTFDFEFIKVFPSEIELVQYTGLKDKNGKEIYESDVFKDDDWWVGKATVEFYRGVFGWWSDGGEEFISLNDCKNIEIIGNIYENKELLND